MDGVLVHEGAELLAQGARITRFSAVETAAMEKGLIATTGAGKKW